MVYAKSRATCARFYPLQVALKLSSLQMDTVFGPVGFNAFRQNVLHSPVVAQARHAVMAFAALSMRLLRLSGMRHPFSSPLRRSLSKDCKLYLRWSLPKRKWSSPFQARRLHPGSGPAQQLALQSSQWPASL